MKVTAVNGSPRKNHSTARLLKSALEGAASKGAQTGLVHLYDSSVKGCVSCFGCKRRDNPQPWRCVLKDSLSPILDRVLESDILFLGAPVYLADVPGGVRCFIERLLFPCVSYDKVDQLPFPGSISTALFFTMNAPRVNAGIYTSMIESNVRLFYRLLKGEAQYMISCDTYQFDDYNKYAARKFDLEEKERVRDEEFPADCKRAFEMGAALVAR